MNSVDFQKLKVSSYRVKKETLSAFTKKELQQFLDYCRLQYRPKANRAQLLRICLIKT